ncbi:GNAT family N-acetyltransferase [Bacillus kexueae]|uniref:GNAT family N-acetyltransferase n=1 Tax=Aeribacillus kexueae TaxID=2078952 RepID=UPI001FAF1E1C|nr:GNAT family N-acetyltransferase [Bacillus kexueae]
MISIKELKSNEERQLAYPVMNQLRAHLHEEEYLNLVIEAAEKEGYRQFGLFEGDEIVAVIGFQPMITLYYGKYLWVCDLVTDSKRRSQGYGEILLSHIHELAIADGYEKIALSSGLKRTEAHRFYEEKMHYEKVSYVFKVDVNSAT